MAEAIKFTFEEMFDTSTESNGSADHTPAPAKKTRWTEEELEEIKSTARAEGFAEAMASAEAQTLQANTAAFDRIADATSNSLTQLTQTENAIRTEAASLALGIARKLADVLITLRPEVEIEAVIRECMTHLTREPRLVIRINDAQTTQIEETIHQAAAERGMADKLMIVGDASLAIGDCEIEWSNGGVSRNRADLDHQITEIIERYIEALTGEATQAANEENTHERP